MNAKSRPLVTVLMPVYNGSKYLDEAIESILNQTFIDFEFLIIDDCSIDNSIEIITRYHDSRIRLVENNNNLGQSKTLNKGIDLALGKYIARMDQDDISLPKRLEEQVNYFKEHSDISVLGTWWKAIIDGELDDQGNKIYKELKLPEDPDTCAFWMYFYGDQPIAHPCVMFEKNKIKDLGRYNVSYKVAQDIELWLRALSNKLKFANVPEFLFLYRLHQDQGSKSILVEEEHNRALAEFISSVLNRNIDCKQSARFRSKNFNDCNFTVFENVKEMLHLKMDVLDEYLKIYTIPSNQVFEHSMMIWSTLQKLGSLKAIRWRQIIIYNMNFCLNFIRLLSNYNQKPYSLYAWRFLFNVYPPLIKGFLRSLF